MSNIVDLEKLFHRSKDRIKDLGEVFTPESYVEDMLTLLAKDRKSIWSDENIVFFEPCSGHGNIVLAIYKRRLEGMYKKALSQGTREPAYYAVANALNTLWAIDIDSKNIESCRTRVLATTFDFLKEKLNIKSNLELLAKKKDFFSHILSAIKWHIDENETLSALSDPQSAKANANLTKSGAKWFSQNKHHQLDFELTWVEFYDECDSANTIPLEYERANRFVVSILSGKSKGFEDFEFAKEALQFDRTTTSQNKKNGQPLSIGA